jgi:hypothetical protein
MPCERVSLPGGGAAIVCSGKRRTPRCACGAPAPLLCDWKVAEGKTCDKPICRSCTHVPAPDKDLCPTHAAEWKSRLAAKAAPTKGPTGVITGGYTTRTGEPVYIIAWDDNVTRPMVDIDAPPAGLEVGARVMLVGRQLQRRAP